MLDSEVEQHRRDEEMRAARLRMQERFNATAEVELARMQELEKQRDEERRKQKVEEWERLQQGKGYYSKNRTQTETNDVPATLGTRMRAKPKDSKRVSLPSSGHLYSLRTFFSTFWFLCFISGPNSLRYRSREAVVLSFLFVLISVQY